MTFHGRWRRFDFNGEPAALLAALAGERHAFLLESARHDTARGQYSLLGCDPFEIFKGQGPQTLDRLRRRWQRFASEPACRVSPLGAGLVGYLAYELGLALEGLPYTPDGEPEAVFGFYDVTLTVDHAARRLYVFSSGLPEQDPRQRRARAQERLEWMCGKISAATAFSPLARQELSDKPSARLFSDFSRAHYLAAVRRAKAYIAAGDIYQVNLSRRERVQVPAMGGVDPVDLYLALGQRSPAPFAGYFDAGDLKLISSSPERFVRLRDGLVETRPMKGTRPRGASSIEDARHGRDLLASAKDKAELLMITDLMRNDLGRVCRYGSVHVRQLRALERYRTVFQTTSTVEGRLAPGRDAFDLLRAVFPGGSITGCPKIRAMEVIRDLEPVSRGPYTGALGYIGFNGDLDFNILIRTMICRQDEIALHTGGGIVADSVPEDEYTETQVKARAMREVLEEFFILRHSRRKEV